MPAVARSGERGVAQASEALDAGDARRAQRLLDTLIPAGHAPEAELLQVRTAMQLGHYRQALSLAAHVAGEAEDGGRAAALYAWLLDRGGQPALAQAQLLAAQARWPDSAWPALVHSALGRAAPRDVALLRPPLRAPAPLRALPTGGAVLLPGGTRALGPALAASATVTLRNGLGDTVTAQPERDLLPGLTLWRLSAPLPAPLTVQWLGQGPFGGAPAATAGYPATGDAGPQWPLLRQGFLGAVPREGQLRGLAFDPAVAGCAPVFDASGRVAGVLMAAGGSLPEHCWLPASAVLQALELPAGAPVPRPPPTLDPGSVYEVALLVSLQLVAAHAPPSCGADRLLARPSP